jgi:hypothetical protein
MAAVPRVLVSAEAVPYRPNLGVYVIVREQAAGATDEDSRLADALLAADGVAGAWTFATQARFDRHGWKPGNRTVTVCYLDADPLSVAPGIAPTVRAAADDQDRPVLLAGPFETITPWRWDWFDGS